MDKLIENDPELSRFIMEIEQAQRMRKTTEKLTDECWNLCVSNPNVSRFDGKTESCIVNCVERFIDSSTFIVENFSKLGQSLAVSSGSSSGFSSDSSFSSEPEMILEEKPAETKKKSGWW
jgi:import inner membrane translocase subunit TIM8